ncbi:MAG: DUF4291 domain-containing protein [Archangium gephyra]|uniref:DUF4291 domain-containing protein n=1 Tax=Archangium gephyra TaxID=48 RepID=A0A2W5VPD4_9BACT|nr:MAG: DUF4291 domain-containing protein [Archangium gephyra]
MTPIRQIRATWDTTSITVYQAYDDAIADAAVRAQKFVAPFSFARMTWVKPSFLWMMERSGWATKAGQRRVLSVRVRRDAFDDAVTRAVSTSVAHARSMIRVQWDPERDLRGAKLPYRSLQLGLGREVISAYASEWILGIEDVTKRVKHVAALRRRGAWERAAECLPVERPYAVGGA